MPASDGQNRGFTLIELAVLLLIAALLAVTVLPRYPGKGLDVGARAEQLASDIRYVQTLSMSRGERYCLHLDASSYQIRRNNCSEAVTHPVAGTLSMSLPGTSIAAVNLIGNNIEFDGKGQPTTLASPALATITLSAGGASKTVVVTPQTGRVVVP